jgi:cytoskeletal protein CcmA (bactofilin family)
VKAKRAHERPGTTILEPGTSFNGLLASSGDVRVEGELEGEVVARGTLWIGPRGRVKGTVEADELVVAGVLEGQVVAHRRLELLATAHFEGSLRTPTVVLAEGAYLSGQCRTGDSPEDAGEAEESLPSPL